MGHNLMKYIVVRDIITTNTGLLSLSLLVIWAAITSSVLFDLTTLKVNNSCYQLSFNFSGN